MSGLTSYYYYEDRVITPATHQYRVYHAVEADKEIAELQAMLEERNKQVGELKKERDWLAKDRAQAYDDLEKRAQLNIKQEESIRHQKYKRCVAMASYWVAVSYQCVDDKHRQRAEKRHYKWLELAEKFKEAK